MTAGDGQPLSIQTCAFYVHGDGLLHALMAETYTPKHQSSLGPRIKTCIAYLLQLVCQTRHAMLKPKTQPPMSQAAREKGLRHVV